ncbi:phage tail tape measure protein [Rhodococcus sp. NPDC060176]|uniref:phage tail tape measure protein n=1 Tax=Rhodococcus sp. NPDC060176 TaxID=3347062 RepID=UPI003654C149
MATIGYATLPIIPSMQGISGNLSQLIGAPIVAAGQRAGQDAGRAVGRGMAGGMSASQSTVEAASAKLAAARGKEADAAGKVRVAELKLQELRDKGTATASQIAAAEERLATAERGRDTAVSNRLRAVNDLTQARARAANGADEEADAIDDATEAQERNADGAVDLAKKLGGLAIAAAGIGSAMDLAMQGLDNDMVMDKLAASLGASPELAKEYGESAGRLYRSGLGESMDDVATAIASVQTSFKTLGFEGEVSMDKAAERAMNFANTFDQDVSASVQSAAQLVKNGLAKDSTEAFDLMTAAAQRVGPAMRDELPELMNEYGTFFSSLGFSGQEAFGMLVNSSEQGAIAMDKVGDALKEFGIRATDIGDTAAMDTLTELGLNATDTANDLLAGGDAAKTAFGDIISGLQKIEDPSKQAAAALAVIGTPMEDLNKVELPAFLDSMSGAGDAMIGFEGSADQMGATLNDNLGSKIESIKRTVQGFASDAIMGLINGFTNLGTGATNLWNNLGPVNEIFSQAKDTVSLFIGTLTGEGADVDLPWMNTVIDLGTRVRGAFDEVTGGFTAFKNAFVDGGNEVTSSGFAGFLEQLGIYARDIADTFNITVMPAIRTFGDIAMDVGSVALPLIFDAIVLVKDVLVTLGEGIFAVVNFFKEHQDVAIALAGILTASLLPTLITMGITLATQAGLWIAQTAALTGYVLIQGAANTATKVWAAGQWLLNAALSANPIGIVIGVLAGLVAAVVLAYNHSETFRNIVQAAWQGIQDVISFAWNNVVQPVLGFFADRIREVGTVVTFFYDNVVKPYFELVGTVISTVIDGAKLAFGAFMDSLKLVGSFFSDTVDGIKSVWSSLYGLLAKPINFMINTVWNDGILKAWNVVAEFLPGLSPAAPLAGIPEHATGGRISGPGTGTSDDVLMWGSNNEHMLTAREVQLAGGHNAVYAIRDMIMRGVPFTWDGGQIIRDLGRGNVNAYGAQVAQQGLGNVDPQGMFDWMLPKYKDGGEIRPAWESQLENGHRAAKMRNGNPYTWGHEDCSGYMSMIADAIINGGDGVRRWATGSFPGGQPWVPGLGQGFSVGVHDNPGGPGGGHTAGTLTGVGPYSTVNVESGGAHGNVAYGGPAAGADSGQFVGVSPGQYHLAIGADGAFESGGGGGGPSPEQKQDFLQRKIADIFDKALNPVKDTIASAIGSPPPELLGIPPTFLDTGRDKVSGFLADKALALGDLLSSAWDKAKDLGSKLTFGLFDQGGLASGTGFMPKNVIAPERVLSPAETKAWELLVPHLVSLAPALEHFESVVTSPAFTSAQSLLADGEFTPGFRESFGVEESSPIVNAVLGVRDQLKGIVPDLFGTTGAAAGEATGEVDSLGAVEPGMETGPSEPIGGAGVASSYGEGTEGNPEADKWTEWAQNAGKQWEDYFKDNWKEMLNTAVGVGLGGRGGSGDTFNINGSNDTQIARVIQRNQRRKSLAQQRSGGFGRG